MPGDAAYNRKYFLDNFERLSSLAKDRYRTRQAAGRCMSCQNQARLGLNQCEPCGLRYRIRKMKLPAAEAAKALAAVKSFDGRCQCCGGSESGHENGWVIDHDHATLTFRGIVCHQCNIMFGMARDCVKILALGISYLTRNR